MLMTAAPPAPLTTADVIAEVFRKSESSEASLEECSIHVIPQGIEPRWIILGKPSNALPVLRSWAPWKASSRVSWNAVRVAAATNALPMMPGVQNSVVRIDTSYWRAHLQCFPERWSAVIHVGSPSHTRKAILFLIENGEQVVCAAKVPLVTGAEEAIFNEAEMLDLLRQFDYLPRVLFHDRDRGVAAQSWLHGKPVSRGFTEAHLDLLNSLTNGESGGRVSDYRPQLESALEASDLPFDRSVLARGIELLDCDRPLRRFVEHRDFAPWNLKWIRKGVLGLLDWEWAVPDGLPWQDACRFFYLDDVHFRGCGMVWEQLSANEFLLRYRQHCEVPPDALPALTMRYLLRELHMEWEGGNPWLAGYAYRQIQSLLHSVWPVRA
jgi:hypothetical protein